MYSIVQDGEQVLVSYFRNDERMNADGSNVLKTTDKLFGVNAGTL